MGKGWSKILNELYDAVEYLEKTYPGTEIYIEQIKEKFGGLRFYYSANVAKEVPQVVWNMFERLTGWAEASSISTCEQCGEWGERRNDGWILTLCSKCYKLRSHPADAVGITEGRTSPDV